MTTLTTTQRITPCLELLGWTDAGDVAARVAWLQTHFQVDRFAALPPTRLEAAILALCAAVATWARPSADEEWTADLPPITDPGAPCTLAQRTAIAALRDALDMNAYHFKNFLLQKAGVDRLPSLTVAQADYVQAELQGRLDRRAAAPG